MGHPVYKTHLRQKYLSGDVIQLTKKVTDTFVGTVVAFINDSSLDTVNSVEWENDQKVNKNSANDCNDIEDVTKTKQSCHNNRYWLHASNFYWK